MKIARAKHWGSPLLFLVVIVCCITNLGSSSAVAENKQQLKQKLANDETHQESALSQATSGAEKATQASSQDVSEGAAGALAPAGQQLDEEYIEVKPEEINSSEGATSGKSEDSSSSASAVPSESQHQQPEGEQKSSPVDEQLNAHLVQDTIHEQESSYSAMSAAPIGSPAGSGPISRAAPAGHRANYQQGAPQPQPQQQQYQRHQQGGRSKSYKIVMSGRPMEGYQQASPAQRMPPAAASGPARAPRSPQGGVRMRPSYITIKGKLTGINSVVSQYPHPAPGYPHQGPRHLPRGAAAGYAAFRDFVRAQAHKYKPQQQAQQITSYGQPQQQYQQQPERPAAYNQQPAARPAEQSVGYGQEQAYGQQQAAGYQKGGYKAAGGPQKTKVTVAQAFIPHTASEQQQQYNTGADQYAQAPYTNPVLARLYGNHAPRGVGKPEYSKDYGMVLHYPEATVYTEPMSVEKLHKLAGSGISELIEQLQYNLAHGYRDESNMIRANNKHHLGNGVTIHAKEYMAPGKSGQYVPTTAAVISTNAHNNNHAYSAGQPLEHSVGMQKAYELGSGYERVKQAAASQAHKYPERQQEAYQQPSGYEMEAPKLRGNGEPLTSLTHLLGNELESLYRANEAFTKHMGPEIQAGIHAYQKAGHGKGPLKYSELQAAHRAPGPVNGGAQYRPRPQQNRHMAARPQQQHGYQSQQGPQYAGHRGHMQAPRKQQPNRYQAGRNAHRQPQQQHRQQPAYNMAAEQALQQQMQQLLHDFQNGDDQYNGKTTPMINQGYPHKVMQKHQEQAHRQQQQQQHNAYNSHDGVEIPQGPNDQIGEISELIEALKGSLEHTVHQPAAKQAEYQQQQPASEYAGRQKSAEVGKVEGDVRYLASTLGQAPSYAMQVPVAQEMAASYEGAKKAAASEEPATYQQPQQLPAYQQPAVEQPGAYQQQQAPADRHYGNQQAPQAAAGYGAQQQAPEGASQQQQQDSYAYHQAMAAYSQQQAGGYGERQQQANGYQAAQPPPADYQQQQQQQQEQYQQAHQQHQQQVAQVPSDYSNAQQAAAYASPAQAEVAQQAAGYSAGLQEHNQVINHLVPVAQAAPAGAYEQQPSPAAVPNQIGLAAPTEAHYQQAQPLSTFVESLPTDYQELLRQPALIEANGAAAAAAVNHFGALLSQQQQPDSYQAAGQQQAVAAASGGYAGDQATSQSVVSPTRTEPARAASAALTNQQQASYQSKGKASSAVAASGQSQPPVSAASGGSSSSASASALPAASTSAANKVVKK